MKAYQSRQKRIVEVTFHCFSHVGSQLVECVGLRDDVGSDSAGDKSALRRFFDNKQDFRLVSHTVALLITLANYPRAA